MQELQFLISRTPKLFSRRFLMDLLSLHLGSVRCLHRVLADACGCLEHSHSYSVYILSLFLYVFTHTCCRVQRRLAPDAHSTVPVPDSDGESTPWSLHLAACAPSCLSRPLRFFCCLWAFLESMRGWRELYWGGQRGGRSSRGEARAWVFPRPL